MFKRSLQVCLSQIRFEPLVVTDPKLRGSVIFKDLRQGLQLGIHIVGQVEGHGFNNSRLFG